MRGRLQDRLPYAVGAGASALALLAGRFLQADQVPLPGCLFRHITGISCLFCGGTRAFFAAAQGRYAEAWHFSPLGLLAWPAAWLLLAWCLFRTARPRCANAGG